MSDAEVLIVAILAAKYFNNDPCRDGFLQERNYTAHGQPT